MSANSRYDPMGFLVYQRHSFRARGGGCLDGRFLRSGAPRRNAECSVRKDLGPWDGKMLAAQRPR